MTTDKTYKGLLLWLIAMMSLIAPKAMARPDAPSLRPYPRETYQTHADNDTLVQILIFYPGSEVYELEGHAALRIAVPGIDMVVSYGTFDFNSPNFIYRFVKGETDYMAAAWPTAAAINAYLSEGRRTVAHTIDLTADEKRMLIDLITDNLLPQNRVYRYNYALDNCSTRPLAMIEKAIGDSIALGPATGAVAGERTFRSMIGHYHRDYPWYQFGIDLALGSEIDRVLDERHKSFAPAALDSMLLNAKVGDRRLVSDSEVILDREPDAATQGPTPWPLTPLAATICLMAIALVISIWDWRRKKTSRWFDSIFYLILGIAGLLLTFLIFISVHYGTSPNWLYLWINPLCLLPAVFIWLKKCKTLIKWYQIINFASLTVFCILWAAGVQHINIAMLPVIIADMMRSSTYLCVNHAISRQI